MSNGWDVSAPGGKRVNVSAAILKSDAKEVFGSVSQEKSLRNDISFATVFCICILWLIIPLALFIRAWLVSIGHSTLELVLSWFPTFHISSNEMPPFYRICVVGLVEIDRWILSLILNLLSATKYLISTKTLEILYLLIFNTWLETYLEKYLLFIKKSFMSNFVYKACFKERKI